LCFEVVFEIAVEVVFEIAVALEIAQATFRAHSAYSE
jgi:hypothetical protein